MPLPLSHLTARVFMLGLDTVAPKFRKIAYRNLATALPQANAKHITDGVFASLARMMVAFSRFPDLHRGNIREWIRYDGFEHFEEGLRCGKGVLFATAHFGAWELSAFAHALMTAPMHVVVRP